MTRDQIAELLEISGNYVYLIETGKKIASEKVVSKLEKLERGELENLELHEGPQHYNAEKLHRISTHSQLASACVEHFIAFLNQQGDSAGRLERTLEKLRKEFPVESPAPRIHIPGVAPGSEEEREITNTLARSLEVAPQVAGIKPKPGVFIAENAAQKLQEASKQIIKLAAEKAKRESEGE